MKIKNDLNLVGLIITLFLGGLAIIFSGSETYAIVLIILSLLTAVLTIIRYYISKQVKIFTSSDEAKTFAKSIYNIAAKEGGELFATHIFPRNDSPFTNDNNIEDIIDIATQELSESNSNVHIEFERILIFENPDIERNWVDFLFNKLSTKISLNLWIYEKYPISFTKLSRHIMPRVNLLLYKGRLSYYTFIGLDNLFNQPNKSLSIAIRSQSAFERAKEYFSGITSFDEIVSVKNYQEYTGRRFIESLPEGIHQVINEIIKIAENHRQDIAFVGLFGSLAKLEKGFYDKEIFKDKESDIDIMIVLTSRDDVNHQEKIKSMIKNTILKYNTDIIWGDDQNYFYEWRKEGKINIDIEIRSLYSSFYTVNKLLAYSIFKYFIPLYSLKGEPVKKYIQVPIGPIPDDERKLILLRNRKGIEDFIERLTNNSEKTDPRRVLSLLLRNLTWCKSGHYSATTELAINNYLIKYWNDIFDSVTIEEVKNILNLNRNEAEKNKIELSKHVLNMCQNIKGKI